MFNRRLIDTLQAALDHEKRRCQELIEVIQKIENRNSAALQYRSAAFPTVHDIEDGWVETFDDLGQKVFIKPN